jgi:hypothetical protein
MLELIVVEDVENHNYSIEKSCGKYSEEKQEKEDGLLLTGLEVVVDNIGPVPGEAIAEALVEEAPAESGEDSVVVGSRSISDQDKT